MVTCSVELCRNYSAKRKGIKRGITFLSFPKELAMKRKWVEALNRHDTWMPTNSSRICSIHFPEHCYAVSQKGRKRLHKDAFPSLYLYHEVNIQDDLYNQAAQSLSSRTPTASSASQLIKLDEETSDGDSNDHTSTSGAGDKYDAFGRYVAAEVRQLDEDQRTIVERIIYEAIHAGKIGSLNGNSKLVVNSETSLIEPSDDDNMCSEDGEVNSQVDAVETKFDIDEPEYVLGESFNEAREVSCLYGVGRKVNAEILITSNVPVEMPQLQVDENICIKVENETEENDNSEKPELSQPFEELLIKQEIKTEDDDPHEDLKTEFVINKQQSSINVYRSTDAKRQRMDCTEEAKIHLELQDSNVKR